MFDATDASFQAPEESMLEVPIEHANTGTGGSVRTSMLGEERPANVQGGREAVTAQELQE